MQANKTPKAVNEWLKTLRLKPSSKKAMEAFANELLKEQASRPPRMKLALGDMAASQGLPVSMAASYSDPLLCKVIAAAVAMAD